MKSLVNTVYDTVKKYNMITSGDKILIGLSGGADSVFLLHMMLLLKKFIDFEIYAAHVNHGIRGGEADRDQNFCVNLCSSLSVQIHTINLNIPKISEELKTSEENAGRIERYKYFNYLCKKFNINKIAVAHNMNDSVETVLINLIRGCSLRGLSGIKPVNNNIIRPIINIERCDIEKYLNDNSIEYCTDSTNLSNIYTRNLIRNDILKSMEKINPSIVKTVYSNLDMIREEDEFICQCVENLRCISSYDNKVIIDKILFDSQSPAIKRRIITEAFRMLQGSYKDIEHKHVEILLGNLFSGNKYDMPNNTVVNVSFDKIVFCKKQSTKNIELIQVVPDCKINFTPDKEYIFTLKKDFKRYCTDELNVDYDKIKNNLILRSRQNGDKISLFGLNGSKKLKQLLIELKIPEYERDNVPILCDGDEIVAVLPYRISEKYKIDNGTKRILNIRTECTKN